jgi:hypothetical protein
VTPGMDAIFTWPSAARYAIAAANLAPALAREVLRLREPGTSQPEATPPQRDGDDRSAALAKSDASSPAPAAEISLTEALEQVMHSANVLPGWRDDVATLERSIAAAREADRAALRLAEELAAKWKALSVLQDKLLGCYRLGTNPGRTLDRLAAARAALAAKETTP